MSKKEFKVGDDVYVKGWVAYIADKKQGLICIGLDKRRYGIFEINEETLFHASDIKPVKKDDVVYEYKYLVKPDYHDLWYPAVHYYINKKEVLKGTGIINCQRITATKRIRK